VMSFTSATIARSRVLSDTQTILIFAGAKLQLRSNHA
jgi:hypothetical protein